MSGVLLERWEGATAQELAVEWQVPQVHLLRRVGSTNDVARRLAEAGAPDRTVVLAEEQLAGRGREGRHWASPAGLGCWLSLLLRGPTAVETTLLPLVFGLAAAAALDPFARPAVVQLKWPNDLLLGGRKLGGILCEGVWDAAGAGFVVVGIGINLLHRKDDFPPDLQLHATSLRQETARPLARRAVASALVREVHAALSQPLASLDGMLAMELERRDPLAGREVVVTGAGGAEALRGVARGIAPDGALLVRTAAGALRRVRSGSVRLRDTGGPAARLAAANDT